MKLFFIIAISVLLPLVSYSQINVLTQHNDNARTGMNLQETELNPTSVDSANFGILIARHIDDKCYAQPLIVSHLNMPGYGYRNVVFVATVNNTVYAFDADDMRDTLPYWHINLTPAKTVVPKNTDLTGACGGAYEDFSGHIGIVGTPVIDTATNTMYLVSRDIISKSTTFEQWFHALDITTGKEKNGGPVKITAKYKGTGDGNVGGIITFDAERQNQRPALALVKGIVYIAWSSHCDWGPYHGWVMGYSADSLKQKCLWMDNPNGYNCGIWMSGQGISSDTSGNLYLSTGNGSVGTVSNPRSTINRGESVLKLSPSGKTLKVASFFTPYEYDFLENYDLDIGSMGVLLVPGTNWAMAGGKEGKAYLLNRDTMGGLSSTKKDKILERITYGLYDELHGAPVFWHNDSNDHVYLWPTNETLFGYKVDYAHKRLDTTTAMTGTAMSLSSPSGANLCVTANGSKYGSGIVWASLANSGYPIHNTSPGILYAYDAGNLKKVLWNSSMKPADDITTYAKFVCPTVANGKLYMPNFSQQLVVYGVIPPFDSFTVSNDTLCQGEIATFTNRSDTSKGKIKTYNWDFGDGIHSSLKNPTHAYKTGGTYRITLTDSAVSSHNIYRVKIQVQAAPKASFRVNDSTQCLPRNNYVFVHDSLSGDSGAVLKRWNFGDSTYATGDSVTHAYKRSGNYSVIFTMVSFNKCADSVIQKVHVFVPLKGLNFVINDSSQCFTKNFFTFTNTSRLNYSTGIKHTWNFGNGTSDTGFNSSFSYNDTGKYKISLKVSTSNGCSDSISKIIEVLPSPGGAYFIVKDSAQCISGNTFFFTDTSTSTNPYLSRQWKFGDGGTGSGKRVSHSYATSGRYLITFTKMLRNKCADSISNYVTVYPAPTGTVAGDTSVKINDTSLYVLKTDTANKITKWQYTGANLVKSSNDSIQIMWTTVGKETLTAFTKSRYGCLDSIVLNVNVSATNAVETPALVVQNLKISPNPNDGQFTIGFDVENSQDISINIMDAGNREVYKTVITNFHGPYLNKIRLSGAGTYFIIIQGNKGRQAIAKIEVQ